MTRKFRYVRTLFALLAWALYLPEAKAYLPETKTPLPEAKAAAPTAERPMADKVFCALNAAEAFEGNDSAYHLSEAVVNAKLKHREIMVPQTLSGEALKRMSNLNVADALRYFSGLQLKDYGGIGGIKTVNIRSMGTHHLGIAYDGIALGNAQNGQIDLGQFSLDNVEEISLYNGVRLFQRRHCLYPHTPTAVFRQQALASETESTERLKRHVAPQRPLGATALAALEPFSQRGRTDIERAL